jgi:hypothetical protein
MTASRFLFLYLWVAPHALQIPIVVIMVRRKMVREFPIFFVYTCFQILQCAVLFTMDQVDYFTGDQYVPTWLAAEYISVGLGLFASVMLATSVVRAHYGAFFERTLMDDIENAGYHCAVILWLTGLVLPARATQQIESPRAPEVEHWNAALQRLLEQ